MKAEDIRNIIREEIQKVVQEQAELWWHKPAEAEKDAHLKPSAVHEKSVPQPYNRKGAKKMTKSQIEKRRKIGKSMMGNEKTTDKFRKKYGQDWKDYLWAAATAATFRDDAKKND